jgi:hypothetical protein
MRTQELVATGDIAAEGFAGLTRQIRDAHGGIAERVFWAVGLGVQPARGIRAIHDGVADTLYAGVGAAGAGAVRAGSRVLARLRSEEGLPVDASLRGRLAVGALNGAIGDALHRRGNGLALEMGVRVDGALVPPSREALRAAFPGATPRIAVFLHGLCETEDAWRLGARRHAPYGERLRDALGLTPVYVRYNTGRHISENGRELAGLLAALEREWPVELAEIALVGHSMGGLVARSATHYGAGSTATNRVRHVVSLGSPHHGARLERLAHAAGAAACRLPETRALAGALRARSVGIRDLYHGYLVDEDWQDYDPQAFLVAAGREIPFLATATHLFVAATVTRDPEAPLGRAVGDLLVSRPSAWAQRPHERVRFPLENYRHVGGATHLDLLNHPAVGDQLVRWLSPRAALAAAAAA